MTPLVPIALIAWPLLTLALFLVMPPRRATLVSVIGGTLFLPIAAYPIPGLPDYSKQVATTIGALIGVAAFDPSRILAFRPRWFDLPMLVYCLVPLASSVTNDLGVYDGLASVFSQFMEWGMPYLLGRLYLGDTSGLRELAGAVVLGALLYVPLCLLEVRLSPQLHTWVYGFHQHQFAQTKRLGGFRPTVFMNHGLMVALWMSSATVLAVWLAWSGACRELFKVPMWACSGVLLVTAVLCKSIGALVLLVAGLGVAVVVRTLGTRAVVLALLLAPPAYIAVRATGTWSGQHMVDLVDSVGLHAGAGSLQFRLMNEDILAEHALKRPEFGWGGWARNRPDGNTDIITDGLWIIALGKYGFVGLLSVTLAILLPPLIAVRRIPARRWFHPVAAPAAALAVVLMMYMIDSLMNAYPNPVYLLAAGGLVGCAATTRTGTGTQGSLRAGPDPRGRADRDLRHMGPKS